MALLPLVPSSDGRPSGTAAEAANVRARARHDERAALIELPVRRDDAPPPNFMLPWKEADEIRYRRSVRARLRRSRRFRHVASVARGLDAACGEPSARLRSDAVSGGT